MCVYVHVCIYVHAIIMYQPSLCKMYYLHFVFKNNYYCNLFLLNHGGMFIYKLISFFHSPFQHSCIFIFISIVIHVHICECWNKIIELN